jgi:heptosyltransferase I
MFTAGKPANGRILVVRLSAMGDIIHTLPAVASLKNSYPGSHLTWVVEPRWLPLLEANPYVDRVVVLRRQSLSGFLESWRDLCAARYDFAVDFQGLTKSALVASVARPDRIFGFHQKQVRERVAALFYSNKSLSRAAHVVDKNLELAAAAGGARTLLAFPLPPGSPEGELPPGDYVLASPLAGWGSKQWPLAHYGKLAARLKRELGIPLVLNGPPGARFDEARFDEARFDEAESAVAHYSGLPGLIHATRRAAAVLGVDSGPLHLAAALGKRGIAIFGPTDPASNGPYGDSLKVLRSSAAATTYRRGAAIDQSMQEISPDEVFEALAQCLVR